MLAASVVALAASAATGCGPHASEPASAACRRIGSDGRHDLAFVRGFGADGDIYAADLHRGTPVRLTHDFGYDGSPAWSPDGCRIAFLASVDHGDSVIVMDADGGHRRTVWSAGTMVSRVSWTSDPDRLVVVDNSFGLKAISLRTGKVRKLVDDYVVGTAQLTPNGKTIVFAGRPAAARPPDELFELSVKGGEPRRLTTAAGMTTFALSPDGRHVAYAMPSQPGPRPTQRIGIWVVDRDGSNPRRLTASDDTDPAWAPDSSHIAFTRRPAGRGNALSLWVTDLTGRGATPALRTRPPTFAAAWSPRSRAPVPAPDNAAKDRFIASADRVCAAFRPRFAAVDASARAAWTKLDRYPPAGPAPPFDTRPIQRRVEKAYVRRAALTDALLRELRALPGQPVERPDLYYAILRGRAGDIRHYLGPLGPVAVRRSQRASDASERDAATNYGFHACGRFSRIY